MSSKRRLRRECRGKVAYAELAQARVASSSLRRRGEGVHVYKCPLCRRFHVGHTPRRIRLAIAAMSA